MFFLFGIDKHRAKKKKWRIPEKTLILGALCFGGIGALFGMYAFHHKTKHASFRIIIPITAAITVIALIKL